ncbi:hypothetical protein E1B28_003802 [Marasmius oreades]|uniref:Uncharacterized protein n=1 Tax=Marasmius oreades TaxID=181124 RepID=A0A9P8ABW4_9AGAR|nr:uncharacterized protein E1B28_003802 [Marasmius oreades]KAG7096358.1 hypothetical protein E1B28_003802 [Marasmius oreades]
MTMSTNARKALATPATTASGTAAEIAESSAARERKVRHHSTKSRDSQFDSRPFG